MNDSTPALGELSKYQPGQRVVLRNLSNHNNHDYDNTDVAMAFDVTDAPVEEHIVAF
jgi:spore coat protein A, manganese oxidase